MQKRCRDAALAFFKKKVCQHPVKDAARFCAQEAIRGILSYVGAEKQQESGLPGGLWCMGVGHYRAYPLVCALQGEQRVLEEERTEPATLSSYGRHCVGQNGTRASGS